MRLSRMAVRFSHSRGSGESLSQEILFQSSQLKRHAAGIYGFGSFLTKARNNLIEVIRNNLEKFGCSEISLPVMQPKNIWQASGRWDSYTQKKQMFTFYGKNGEYCLAPTGEEIVLDFVRDNIESYKDLPINVFQIGSKYRDELRVRGGLLRSKEFLMKDGYSFHSTFDDMVREYEEMKSCYFKIFRDLELDVISVRALSAEMGGKMSEEFMCFSPTGEDKVLVNHDRTLALNVEVLQNSDLIEEIKQRENFDVGDLSEASCIELGHIFQLGRFYSENMDGFFVDSDGSRKAYYMGCYGIGINRTLGAICEINCDEDGLNWPRCIAPYRCVIVSAKEELFDEAFNLYLDLKKAGVSVVLHDLKSSFGSKIKDVKLLGFPEIIIVGRSYLEKKRFEIENRKTLEKRFLTRIELIENLIA